jgi:transcriptional regulator with XRE-family HTH domain
VDDIAFGRLVRMSRIRRGWRQADLAERAGLSTSVVSRLEHGGLGAMQLNDARRVAAVLDIRLEVQPRGRAADLDRTLNWRHAALAEFVAGWLGATRGWEVRPEVSFSEYGERGVVDLLARHEPTGSLLVIELKTEVIDLGEVLGTLDRKRRLGAVIARSLVLIGDSVTNRRRVAAHAALVAAALPDRGPVLARWLRAPTGTVRALRFVSDSRPGQARSAFAAPTMVRRPATRPESRRPRSARPRPIPADAPAASP